MKKRITKVKVVDYLIKTIIIIILVSLYCKLETLNSFAQTDTTKFEIINPKTDSLLNILQTAKQDTVKVNILLILGEQFYRSQPDKALDYWGQALVLAQEIDYKKGIAATFNNIGFIYQHQGQPEKALEYYLKSLKIKEDLGDQKGLAYSLNNIGMIYQLRGLNDKALKYFFKCLKEARAIGHNHLIATSLNNIGLLYHHLGEYDKALKHHFESLKIKENTGDQQGTAFSLNNIGTVYDDKGRYDKALEYYHKCLNKFEEIDHKQGIATSLNNIGYIYKIQNIYDKALEYSLKSLKLLEEINHRKGIANALDNIGSLYYSMNNFDNAIDYCSRSLEISNELGYPEEIKKASYMLSNIYAAMGKKSSLPSSEIMDYYKKAYEYHILSTEMQDSLHNEDKSKEIGRIEARYEMEKKMVEEKTKAEAEAKIKAELEARRNNLQYSGILIFIVLLFIVMSMLGRLTIPVRWAEGIVFFTFLLFFEFTLVLLDPYIERFTGGAPAIKLAFNAALAALIFPLHAFFEGMLKNRILSRKKKNYTKPR
ncbi:MAG: tetratricopeptide repeat protein [Bacteroidota bacterium]